MVTLGTQELKDSIIPTQSGASDLGVKRRWNKPHVVLRDKKSKKIHIEKRGVKHRNGRFIAYFLLDI